MIGKSLEAIVTLNVTSESSEDPLLKYAYALPELFNVSEVDLVSVDQESPTLSVRRSDKPKCERCWRYVPDVASDDRYPTVCLRCAEALEAIGFAPYTATPTEPAA